MGNRKIVSLKDITNNLDNRRIPLNSIERSKKESNPIYPYIGANKIMTYIDEFIFDEKILCIAEDGGSWGLNEKCAVIYNEKVWVNNHAHVLTAKDNLILEYLLHFLNYSDLNLFINGATRGKLTKSALNSIPVPLPSLEEQKRIATLLDTADSLRQKDKELLQKYNELAQSLFLEMFGDPVKNEKGWEKKTLKAITTKIGSGSTPSGGKESYFASGTSLIRSLNVHDRKFKLKDLAFIDDSQALKLKNVTVVSNDILFNITGASVCRCTIVPEEILPARVNQHVSILRPKTEILNPEFLCFQLISDNVKRNLYAIATQGGATREAITKEQLESFEIIVPKIELQNKFAEQITLIEKQKELMLQNAEKSEALFQGLLQEAFK